MKIYHFATLIQFIAAIYLALSFDSLIEKAFWTKQYEHSKKRLLDNFKMTFNGVDCVEEKSQEIELAIKNKCRSFITRTSKFGIMMLALSILLLIFQSFEQSYISFRMVIFLYFH